MRGSGFCRRRFEMNIGMVARRTGLVAVLGGAALVGSVNLEREASAGGGGGCHGSPEREGSRTLVALAGNCFSPIVLNVETGATVTFENMDQIGRASCRERV